MARNLGEPPAEWLESLETSVRKEVMAESQKAISLERLLWHTYHTVPLPHELEEADDDGYQIEEEKPEKMDPEFSDQELARIAAVLSPVLSYDPATRGTPGELWAALEEVWSS